MPNHIVNLIEFQSSADLQRVLAECKSEDRLFDFNAIIPMPASLQKPYDLQRKNMVRVGARKLGNQVERVHN